MAKSFRRDTDVVAELAADALSDPALERVVLSGPRPGGALRRVEIRPVMLRGRRLLQVARYDDRRSATSNVDSAADPLVRHLLGQFRNLTAQTATQRTQARLTKKQRTLMTVVDDGKQPDLRHDRVKQRLIEPDAPFLELLGMARDGSINPSAQGKWRQIGEFLRLLSSLPAFEAMRDEPTLRLADLGCGNAYLTFATYHYVTEVLGRDCRLVGVDRNADAVARANERAARLGWAGLSFQTAEIATAELAFTPDIVIALHACDTATDDAAYRAITSQARGLLLAPCCHHDLQQQLAGQRTDGPAALLRPALLREHLGDVLTDALRTALIASCGYRTDVVQFVAPEHTPKNVMIRASIDTGVDTAARRREYAELRDQWHVRPYLQRLLDGEPVREQAGSARLV